MLTRICIDPTVRAATLSADDTLTDRSARLQVLDPNGADRTITLPVVTAQDAGLSFAFTNPAVANSLLVVDSDAVAVQTVGPGASGIIYVDELGAWRTFFNSALSSGATLTSPTLTTPNVQVLVMTGTTGNQEIRLTTNLADALSVEDTAGDLIVVDTTTGAQRITFTPATTFTGVLTSAGGITLSGAVDLTFSGTTGQSEIVVTDNLADALSIKDSVGGADIIVITTTNGSEAVTVTPLLTGTKIQVTATAVTATADGLTTGLIPSGASHVTVTSDNADKIITLPAPVVGHKITIVTGATGCELRTVAASNVAINDVDSDGGANECALAADSHFHAECISATEWIVVGYTKLGAVIAALVPDAV